jgi:putative phage-type endonuclease
MPEPKYHYEIEQGTDEWHALRRGMITASAVKAIMTPSGKTANNATSRTHLLKLLAERLTSESDPSYYNDDMARGHLLEPYARDLYSKHYAPVVECGFITRNLGGCVLGYSPDGLVGDDGLIEIKSRLAKHHLASLLADEVPSEYMLQMQTGLAVTGREWCDYISYTPGLPLFVSRVLPDSITIAQIELAALAAEEQISSMLDEFQLLSQQYPATEKIQLKTEGEIII